MTRLALTTRIRTWAKASWPLILVLLFATLLRVALRGEVILDKAVDSLPLAKDAWHLAEAGVLEGRASLGLVRTLFTLPIALVFKLAGFSRSVPLAFSLVASLASIVLLYALVRRAVGSQIALAAALILACLPADIFAAGVVLPASLLLTLGLLGVYFLWRFFEHRRWKWVLASLAVAALLAVYDPALASALFAYGLFAAISVYKPRSATFRRNQLYIWLVVAFAGLNLTLYLSDPARLFSGFDQATQQPGVFLYLLLALFSLSLWASTPAGQRYIPRLLVWFFVGLLAVGIDIQHATEPLMFSAQPSFIFALLPLAILTASILQNLKVPAVKWLPFVLAGLMLFWLPTLVGDFDWLPDYAEFDPLAPYAIVDYALVVAGLVAVAAFLAAWYRQTRLANAAAVVVLAAFLIGLIPSAWELTLPHRLALQNAETAITKLRSMSARPVLFSNNLTLDYYNFVQGYEPSQVEGALNFSKAPASLEVGDAYVIVPESDASVARANWWLVDQVGLAQPRDLIFLSLTAETARNILAVESQPQAEAAAAQHNLGDMCAAYSSWMRAQATQGHASDLVVSHGLGCFEEFTATAIPLTETEPVRYPLRSLFQVRRLYDGDLEKPVWNIFHAQRSYPDPRTFFFDMPIEPNAFYLFTGVFQATEETSFLYWHLGEQESFAHRQRAADWTPLALLIYTGNQVSESGQISLSPALIDNYGFVYFHGLLFTQIPAGYNPP